MENQKKLEVNNRGLLGDLSLSDIEKITGVEASSSSMKLGAKSALTVHPSEGGYDLVVLNEQGLPNFVPLRDARYEMQSIDGSTVFRVTAQIDEVTISFPIKNGHKPTNP